MESWNENEIDTLKMFENFDTADPSPLHRNSFDHTQDESIDDDTEHFRQYVSTSKHLSSNYMLKKTQKYPSPSKKIGMQIGKPLPISRSPMYNNFLQEPDRMSGNFQSNSRDKPEWNNRVTATDIGIPSYDSSNDKYLRRHKKMMMSRKTKTLSAAYRPLPPRVLKKSKSNSASQSPSSLSKNKQKQSWPLKENIAPHMDSIDNTPHKINQSQIQQKLDDLSKLLEEKENEIRQSKIDKVNREKILEKLKNRIKKQNETEEILKSEKEKLEERLNHLSKKKSIQPINTGTKPLNDIINKQKQQLMQLQNEVNMFKMQNQMLRAQEKETREKDSTQDVHEELIKLRKQIRIEKERSRILKEKVDEFEKSSQKISKLRNYLEKEKKDSSKMQAQNTKVQQQYQDLLDQFQQSKQQISELEKEKTQLLDSIHQQKDIISIQKNKIDQLENNGTTLEQRILEIEKNSSGVAKVHQSIQQQVFEKEEDLKRVTRRVAQLEKEKSDLESLQLSLKAEHEKILNQNKKLENQVNNLHNSQLKEQSSIEIEVQKLSRENEYLKTQIQKWEMEQSKYKDVQFNYETSMKLNEKLKIQVEELTTDYHNMKELKEKSTKDLESIKTSLAQKDQQIQQIQKQNIELQSKIENQIASLSEVEELRQKLQETTERCNVLSESNSLLLMRLKREESKNK